MSYGTDGVRPVHTQYGSRDTGTTAGVERSINSEQTLSFEFKSSTLGDGFIPPYVIPQYAQIISARLTVHTPITTGATFHVGGTAPGTNGIPITTANLGTAGVYDLTPTGTWAFTAFTTADEAITTDATAATATAKTEGGLASLTVQYVYKNRLHGAQPPAPPNFPIT